MSVEGEPQDALDRAALAAWLSSLGIEADRIEDVRSLSGGTQNLILRFSAGGRSLVLRRPPPGNEGAAKAIQREATILPALANSTVPHARFVGYCPDASIVGAPFLVCEEMAGFNATNEMPGPAGRDPQWRRQMGLALADGLAQIAAVPIDGALAQFGKLDGYIERQVSRWASQLDGYGRYAGWPGPSDLGPVGKIGHWLDDNRPQTFQPGLMHGDYHVANVLYRHDAPELAAVLDWEMAALGDPLLDLARLATSWPDANNIGLLSLKVEPWDGWPTANELVRHYAERSGRSLDYLEWFEVLACYKFGAILEGTYARSCAGQADPVVGRRLHASARGLIARAAAMTGAA